MTKALRFTQAEILKVAIVAKQQGVTVKMSIDGSILVSPDKSNIPALDSDEDDGLDRELRAFEAKHGYG